MKTLYILRHAEAMPDRGEGDHERVLSPKGEADARALGALMKEKNYLPALAVCSTARRTAQTLEGVTESLDIAAKQFSKEIYHAQAGDLLAIIRTLDDKYDSALIVGHNPTIHEIAGRLADDSSTLADQISLGYRPGTLSVFSVPRASWKDLSTGENRLSDILAA